MQEILFISLEEVINIQIVQIEMFGGIHGLRDSNLLESALETPKAQFDGTCLHENIFEMAAAYMYHITKNHPFLDGNKRTGMATGLIFLQSNSIEHHLTNQEIYELGYAIATSNTTKKQIAKILQKHQS